MVRCIVKDKKVLRWRGLHLVHSSMIQKTTQELETIRQRVMVKKQKLADVSKQYLALRSIVELNKTEEANLSQDQVWRWA